MVTAVSNFCYKQINSDVTYNRRNPQTLVVLIPVVSSVVQAMQVYNIKSGFINSPRTPTPKLKQLSIAYTWNALGALAQTTTFIAIAVFANSFFFLALGCLAAYQLSLSIEGIKEMGDKIRLRSDQSTYDMGGKSVIDKMWTVLSKDNPYP